MPGILSLDPTLARRDGHYCLNYELPFRIYTSLIYPFESPNGSKIVIYGHDSGLTVCWRGGRRPRLSQSHNQRAAADDSIMIIDSDDEAENKDQLPALEFGTHAEEYDETRPYDEIVYSTDFELDSPAIRVAFPNVAPSGLQSLGSSVPPTLKEQIMLLVAGADSTVKLITLPLEPRAHKDNSSKGVLSQVVPLTVPGSKTSSIATSLSLTWTTSDPRILRAAQGEDEVMDNSSEAAADWEWDILAASYNSQPLNQLTVYSIPIVRLQGQWIVDGERSNLLHNINLPSPVASLAFSTSLLSSSSQTHLVVAHSNGRLRLFDPVPGYRRDSKEKGPIPSNWLTTFTTPFNPPGKTVPAFGHANSRHKRIIDVQWGRGGSSIVALLEDGEWGLWELESNSANSTTKPSHINLSSFSLRGVLGNSLSSSSSNGDHVSHNSSTSTAAGSLAPMTPNTRKAKSKTLFHTSGSSNMSKSSTSFGSAAQGSISILPSTFNRADSSILFCYNRAAYYLPSLLSYWQRARKLTGQGAHSGTLYGPNIPDLQAVSAGGERITSVSQFHGPALPVSTSSKVLQQDILVSAEHRFLIVSPGNPDPAAGQHEHNNTVSADEPLQPWASSNPFGLAQEDTGGGDQTLLSRGDLDLGGVDRMLDGMSRGRKSFNLFEPDNEPVRERRVGFAEDIAGSGSHANPFVL